MLRSVARKDERDAFTGRAHAAASFHVTRRATLFTMMPARCAVMRKERGVPPDAARAAPDEADIARCFFAL